MRPINEGFEDKRQWTPILPIPTRIPLPNLNVHKYLKDVLIDPSHFQRDETGRYPYIDAKNQIVGYVVRLEEMTTHDILYKTLTYCQHESGEQSWFWKEFSTFLIYNLYELLTNRDKKVLIVEGEKTSDAAKLLFPDYVVITWLGGSSTYDRVDWTPLQNRTVIVWPDNDDVGIKVVFGLADLLPKFDVDSVSTVHYEFSKVVLPVGWDLADPLPIEWQNTDLNKILDNSKMLYGRLNKNSTSLNNDPNL